MDVGTARNETDVIKHGSNDNDSFRSIDGQPKHRREGLGAMAAELVNLHACSLKMEQVRWDYLEIGAKVSQGGSTVEHVGQEVFVQGNTYGIDPDSNVHGDPGICKDVYQRNTESRNNSSCFGYRSTAYWKDSGSVSIYTTRTLVAGGGRHTNWTPGQSTPFVSRWMERTQFTHLAL